MTYNPASFICGHVTVHLHTLAGVPVNVYGVDAAQALSIQQVLGTVLRRRKQTTPWKTVAEAWGRIMIWSFLVQHLAFGNVQSFNNQ